MDCKTWCGVPGLSSRATLCHAEEQLSSLPLLPGSDPGQAGDWKAAPRPGLWPIPGEGTPGRKPGALYTMPFLTVGQC